MTYLILLKLRQIAQTVAAALWHHRFKVALACSALLALLILRSCSKPEPPPVIDIEKIDNTIRQVEERNNERLGNTLSNIDRRLEEVDGKLANTNKTRGINARDLEEKLK